MNFPEAQLPVFVRFEPRFQEQLLTLHRSAIEGFDIGMESLIEEKDLRDIPRHYLEGGGEFLVGLLGESVVAMGGFRRISTETAELKRMRIRPELQGRGIGSHLLKDLESRARNAGIQTLCLETAKRRPLTPRPDLPTMVRSKL